MSETSQKIEHFQVRGYHLHTDGMSAEDLLFKTLSDAKKYVKESEFYSAKIFDFYGVLVEEMNPGETLSAPKVTVEEKLSEVIVEEPPVVTEEVVEPIVTEEVIEPVVTEEVVEEDLSEPTSDASE